MSPCGDGRSFGRLLAPSARSSFFPFRRRVDGMVVRYGGSGAGRRSGVVDCYCYFLREVQLRKEVCERKGCHGCIGEGIDVCVKRVIMSVVEIGDG
jgi:hypothetical protein